MSEDLRRKRLRAMGVILWQPRAPRAAQHVADAQPPAVAFSEPMGGAVAVPGAVGDSDRRPDPAMDLAMDLAVDLAALRAQVSVCTRCDLHQSRNQTVFGVGDESARLLVIGEAPGADEDAQGEPFVGRAGKLLNAMLMGIGLAREQVYITNILKCRPPRNRDPHADEVVSCGHYLQQQIAFVAPELILAVGRVAAQNLLGVTTPIGKLRGNIHTHAASALPVLVTYHPAYLLRSPLEKRRVWQDLKMVAARLGIEP
jgi:DNA polymerase